MSELVLSHQASPGALGANISAIFMNTSCLPAYVGNDGVAKEIGGAITNSTLTGNLSVAGTSTFNGRILPDYTDSATVGAVTVNKPSGRVNVANAATTLVVTNNFCTANSHVFVTAAANDTTGRVNAVVRAAGSFTIHCDAPSANMPVDFLVIGQ